MANNSYNFPARQSSQNLAGDKARFNRPVTKHRGKFFWFFVIIGIVVLGLGLQYIYQNIKKSVGYDVPGFVADQLAENNNSVDIESLKKTDTDQDGLTDYQEVYQYQTSRFLPDTDSDTYSDFDEATKGDDPLCPRGENCNLLQLITPKTKIAEVIAEVSLDPNLTFADAMAAEFKKFLIDSGIPESELAGLTTEDFLAMMDALENSGIFDEDTLSATTTPGEIRQFLLSQSNANAEEINRLSDEDLIKIRDKILEGQ